MLVRGLPGRVLLQLLLAGAGGALPAIFAVLVGRLVAMLPAAVASGGLNTPAGRSLIELLVTMGVVLLAEQIATSCYDIAKWAFYRRYEHYVLDRVITATLGVRGLELFENPKLAAVADSAVRLAGWELGDLVDGLCCRWLRIAEGLAAAALVASVWPPAAALLTITWLTAGTATQTALRRLNLELRGEALREAEYVGRIAERPEWAKEVRVFGLAGWLAERFGRHWQHLLDQMADARRLGAGRTAAALAAVVAAHFVVLALVVRSGSTGALSVYQITVMLQGMLGMAALVNYEGAVLIEYGVPNLVTALDLERLAARIDQTAPADSASKRAAVSADMPRREIRFHDVGFGYPDAHRPVFEHLNLTIGAGTSLGIVGLNGAGKTTLIKLMTGLERASHGRVTVDGADLQTLDPDAWRRQVAAIFQDFTHYELTARDNIAFGAVETQRDVDHLVAAAAERTGAQKIIDSLPQGLDTPLSRRFTGGVDLSGGQWQRIALARAMAAVADGARVLVLDEPTAQLDVRAEADVYDRFLDLTTDLTTIVISHRFSTVRRADRIVVLDAGQVTEDGTHDELVARGGQYARLFATQAASYGSAASDGLGAPPEGDCDAD